MGLFGQCIRIIWCSSSTHSLTTERERERERESERPQGTRQPLSINVYTCNSIIIVIIYVIPERKTSQNETAKQISKNKTSSFDRKEWNAMHPCMHAMQCATMCISIVVVVVDVSCGMRTYTLPHFESVPKSAALTLA
jgi:hypothetical protein